MTRTGGMIRYHAKREKTPVLIFFCCLMAVIFVVTVFNCRDKGKIALSYGTGGTFYGIPIREDEIVMGGYYSTAMAIDTDYSGLFVLLAVVLTARMITKERRFLTSLGGTRFEILLAHAASVFLMSAALCVLSYAVMILSRLLLLAFGFRFRQGWSAKLIFLGGGDSLESIVMTFAEMIALCGFATLFLALWQRWWKVLLILAGTGFVLLFVLVLQVNFNMFTEDMLRQLEDLVTWIELSLIPFIDRWFIRISRTNVFLRRIVIGLGCMALTYPVLVRMKLK